MKSDSIEFTRYCLVEPITAVIASIGSIIFEIMIVLINLFFFVLALFVIAVVIVAAAILLPIVAIDYFIYRRVKRYFATKSLVDEVDKEESDSSNAQ